MLVREAFEIIKSINKNFLQIENSINETRVYDKNRELTLRAEQVKKNLTNLNKEVDYLKSAIDSSFLNTLEVSSYRIKNAVLLPELGLAKIAKLLHQLDASFEGFYKLFRNFPEITEYDQMPLELILKEITSLISAFNSEKTEFVGALDNDSDKISKIKKELVTESLNIIGKELESQFSDHKQKTEKMLQRFQNKINEVEISTDNSFEILLSKAKTIEELYSDTLSELEAKKEQMDEVLGQTAKRVIAQDYDDSAAEERKAANWLRLGSLACMAVIIYIVCYSFHDSTESGFDWESSIFRTVLVFILSIPAAYLSRESTKHREQQYNYHHTALDLKAITPYIASLPEEDQNRIKISIAERIFASRQTNLNQKDSFPLNTQELMLELIKKFDTSSKPQPEQSKPKD